MKTALFLFFSIIINAQEAPVTFNELPREAKIFLNEHFADNFHHGIKEVERKKITYRVFMNDDTEIWFSEVGNWKKINGKGNKIPYTFIQKPILDYIKFNTSKEFITAIELIETGYIVGLSSGNDVEFDATGVFIKMK